MFWVIDECYLPVETVVCVHDRICVISKCLTGVLLIERAYLHKTRALELGWLNDDLGLES